MAGAIDIVCNLYTPEIVANGQTGLDDDFKQQVRMHVLLRGPVVGPTLEKWTRVVGDSALHGESTVGTNRERHGSLAGWRILGGSLTKGQGVGGYNAAGSHCG